MNAWSEGGCSMAAVTGFGPRVAKDRRFISDEPLRAVRLENRDGVSIKVRLTSYRSLPLSCVEAVELKIDGKEVLQADLRLRVNQSLYRIADLPALSKTWWFILDYADLVALLPSPLGPGTHDVEGTLVTVEPYMTAGRFSFHNSVKKRLPLRSDAAGSQT